MSKLMLIFLIISMLGIGSYSDDGMWMPHQMKDLNLEKEGLKMDPGDLYNKDGTGIMSAVVNLGGGTGSFVSPEGLILTNHHVAFGAIQKASNKKNDYILNGFLAKSREMEIPAIGYIADVLLGYEEVTGLFQKVLKGVTDPEERYKVIEKLEKEIISEKETEAKDRRCVIKSMYSGSRYYLFRFKRLHDIRLVYSPPGSIGNFGGDVDNWMWPRHTGDFSYLRAYVSSDNKGIKFNKSNVPYKPKSYLKISIEGLNEGDFTFVMGYPGRTYRNMTVSELVADIGKLTDAIDFREELIGFLEKIWKDNREVQIRYASLHKGLNNGLKNYTGKLEGFKSNKLVGLKKREESEFIEWCDRENEEKKIKVNLNQIASNIEKNTNLDRRSKTLKNLISRYGNAMLRNAHTIYRSVLEKEKPDIEREPGYQKRDYHKILVRLEHAEKNYQLETDRKLFKFILNLVKGKERALWPGTFRQVLADNKINDFVDKLYSKTSINDKEIRLKMFKMNLKQLIETGDPFILLASKLEKEMKIIRDRQKVVRQEREDLKRIYINGMMEFKKGRIAPDANSSIRFTYGTIKGYSPADGVYYEPFTTLRGVLEKETGKDPFIVPPDLKKLSVEKKFGSYMDKKKGDVVVCFLNTTNVTGGNSGSPVLNAKGEMVGIVFDMTYESVTGDYYVIPRYQRTIHVDTRYVLFVTDFVAGADFLIREMGF